MNAELIFTHNPHQDYNNILTVLDAFAVENEIPLEINEEKLYSIVFGIYRDFPCIDGLEGASIFKKSANFLCYFVAENIIENSFPVDKLKANTRNINNHASVILGLFIASKALLGATIHRDDGPFEIKNSIQLSKHSYEDIVFALSEISPLSSFHLVTVLLEQLVYKSNPEAQYQGQMILLA